MDPVWLIYVHEGTNEMLNIVDRVFNRVNSKARDVLKEG